MTLRARTSDRQIIVEALVALVLFLPGTALASSALEDVTYRGEMEKRCAHA
jgi:hypothetical protein